MCEGDGDSEVCERRRALDESAKSRLAAPH